MTDSERAMRNMRHYADITRNGNMRRHVEDIVGILENNGWKPLIVSSLRTNQEQAKKVSLGYSKTKNSKHLAGTDRRCRAVDVIDARYGYSTKQYPIECRNFFLSLGRAAIHRGLGWGGLFLGMRLIAKSRLKKWLLTQPQNFHPSDYTGPVGWDPSHLEMP